MFLQKILHHVLVLYVPLNVRHPIAKTASVIWHQGIMKPTNVATVISFGKANLILEVT